jgi:parallel beta-helix repeat protein
VNLTLGGNLGSLLWGGLTLFESDNNSVVDAKIENNSVGVGLYQSNGNVFYHNSFIDNNKQVISNLYSPLSPPSETYSTNGWNNGLEGNYWSDYIGMDLNHDGMGDTPYVVDRNNTDNRPLMGTFSNFTTSDYSVQTICNSTIFDFNFNGTAISFDVSGENGTDGFCRICIPTALLDVPYRVFVNGTEVPYTLLPKSNSTQSYVYFTYQHSTQQAIITPEFPSFLILPLFFITTLMAVLVFKRKTWKNPDS